MTGVVYVNVGWRGEEQPILFAANGEPLGSLEQAAFRREILVTPGAPLPERLAVPERPPSISAASFRKLGASSGRNFSLEERLVPWIQEHQTNTIYPFQVDGTKWLENHDRGMLADDMGLGKSVQSIEAMRSLFRSGSISRAIILAPRSLTLNWLVELSKWAPELSSTVVMPTGPGADAVWHRRLDFAHVVVTSYEQLRKHYTLLAGRFDLVIADEAHRLRNSSAAQSIAFRSLDARKVWFLTGTPVERDVDDLTTLMSILAPNRFSPRDRHLGLAAVRARAGQFILRRAKVDVLAQLPPTVVTHEFIQLSDAQRLAYEKELKGGTSAGGSLARFGRLRAICDADPNTGESSKIDRIVEILKLVREIGEKAIVFSFWREPLFLLNMRLQREALDGVSMLVSEMTLEQRHDAVMGFRKSGNVLLASGTIASEGLTLVEANHAIFLNQYWNPSQNRQAEDRIRRIGQERTTYVYKFSTVGTVEILIDALHEKKNLTEEELIGLLTKQLSSST